MKQVKLLQGVFTSVLAVVITAFAFDRPTLPSIAAAFILALYSGYFAGAKGHFLSTHRELLKFF